MKKEVKKLPDIHLQAAKGMLAGHKKKKNCKKCFDRGYLGTTEDNMLVPCTQCVDNEALFKEWKEYVKKVPELVELYGDSLDEKPEEAPAPVKGGARPAHLSGNTMAGPAGRPENKGPAASATHIRRGAI